MMQLISSDAPLGTHYDGGYDDRHYYRHDKNRTLTNKKITHNIKNKNKDINKYEKNKRIFDDDYNVNEHIIKKDEEINVESMCMQKKEVNDEMR